MASHKFTSCAQFLHLGMRVIIFSGTEHLIHNYVSVSRYYYYSKERFEALFKKRRTLYQGTRDKEVIEVESQSRTKELLESQM